MAILLVTEVILQLLWPGFKVSIQFFEDLDMKGIDEPDGHERKPSFKIA